MQNQGISEMLHLPQIISIFSLLPSGNEIHGVIQSLAWLPAFFVITSLHELHEEVEISKVLSSSSTFSKKGDREILMVHPTAGRRDAQPHTTNHKEIFIRSAAWFYPK